MPRIFACVAVAQLLVLMGAAGLGLASEEATVQRHVVLALFFLLFNCLVQVVLFTYFTVAGKMISKAVHLGGFGQQAVEETKRLKRQILYSVAAIFLTMVVSTATGAWAWRSGGSAPWHLAAGGVLLVAHCSVCYVEFGLASRMAGLMAKTLASYASRSPELPGR